MVNIVRLGSPQRSNPKKTSDCVASELHSKAPRVNECK